MKQEELVTIEIMNFINFWTSDDKEREKMNEVLNDYMKEVFEVHE